MGFLIDSAVLIALEREQLSLEALVAELGEQPLAISAITASELLHGVHRAQQPAIRQQRLAFVTYILDLFPILPVDLAVAQIHAEVWAALQAQGQMVGAHDLLIGATALAHGYGVVTLNLKDFQRIPRLTVHAPGASNP